MTNGLKYRSRLTLATLPPSIHPGSGGGGDGGAPTYSARMHPSFESLSLPLTPYILSARAILYIARVKFSSARVYTPASLLSLARRSFLSCSLGFYSLSARALLSFFPPRLLAPLLSLSPHPFASTEVMTV